MKNVVVIGAGISGLTAAIYARRSGFNVTLLEQHSITGGMCTSWRRKGYLFEGAMHWLTGSNSEMQLNRVWREVGALSSSVEISCPEVFREVECGGKTLKLYRSAEKTRDGLLRNCPEDKEAILKMYKAIKSMGALQPPVVDIKGVKTEVPNKMALRDIVKMLPAISVMGKYSKQSVAQYIKGFKNPLIKMLLGGVVPLEYTAGSLLVTLATLDTGDGGFPEGGSLGLIERMEQTYLGLGGTLKLKTKAVRVLAENGVAKGVETETETLQADAVIIAIDTKTAVDKLFDEKPEDKWLTELYNGVKPSVCTFAGIGVRAELPETPSFCLQTPIKYAGRTETVLGFNNYYGASGHAPEGCTSLTAVFLGDTYDFWAEAKRRGTYKEEKENLAKQISAAMCEKWPQVKGNIDVIDIATPLTYERYTSAYRGSWMGITEPGDKMTQYSGELKSISGVYFAGHRLMPPGGMPAALLAGRTAAQHVCRRFDAVFRSNT